VAFTSSNGQTRTSLAEINITPLVDVVLVLLVIFMITAPVLQSGIEVPSQDAHREGEITEQRMVVTIDTISRSFSAISPSTFTTWRSSFTQAGTDPAHQVIYLRADEAVPFGAFASVMDAVKQAGITNVSIVTQPLDAKAAAGGN
jgi:biopolymer transport protein TolR